MEKVVDWCFYVCSIRFYYYGWKHRPCEALTAIPPPPGALGIVKHPRASASWSCMVDATVTITIPNIVVLLLQLL
jgi:hypothetical protein